MADLPNVTKFKSLTNPYALTGYGAAIYYGALVAVIEVSLVQLSEKAIEIIFIAPLVIIPIVVGIIYKSRLAVRNINTPSVISQSPSDIKGRDVTITYGNDNKIGRNNDKE